MSNPIEWTPESLERQIRKDKIAEHKRALKELGYTEAPKWFITLGVTCVMLPLFALLVRLALWIIGVHI
jgi:hypothetical protein